MALYVKALKAEFDAACSGSYVYGRVVRKIIIPVYIDLGKQVIRKSQPKDNVLTKYKLFKDCTVYFAKTEDQLNDENCLYTLPCEINITVHLYC